MLFQLGQSLLFQLGLSLLFQFGQSLLFQLSLSLLFQLNLSLLFQLGLSLLFQLSLSLLFQLGQSLLFQFGQSLLFQLSLSLLFFFEPSLLLFLCKPSLLCELFFLNPLLLGRFFVFDILNLFLGFTDQSFVCILKDLAHILCRRRRDLLSVYPDIVQSSPKPYSQLMREQLPALRIILHCRIFSAVHADRSDTVLHILHHFPVLVLRRIRILLIIDRHLNLRSVNAFNILPGKSPAGIRGCIDERFFLGRIKLIGVFHTLCDLEIEELLLRLFLQAV